MNAVLRQFLEAYAVMGKRRRAAVADLLALSEAATSRRGLAKCTRDELHERCPEAGRLLKRESRAPCGHEAGHRVRLRAA